MKDSITRILRPA